MVQSLTLSIMTPCFNEQGTIEPALAARENIRSPLASEGIERPGLAPKGRLTFNS